MADTLRKYNCKLSLTEKWLGYEIEFIDPLDINVSTGNNHNCSEHR